MWKWSYDEYYVEMEQEFNKYNNVGVEMEEVVIHHFKSKH